jgi:thiol-disulfide isomerase/thioredoxin
MNDLIVYKFYAPWCGPCRMYIHPFNRVTARLGVKTEAVNIDEQQEIAEEFHVEKIPTTIVTKNGAVVARREGAMIERDLTALIQGAV